MLPLCESLGNLQQPDTLLEAVDPEIVGRLRVLRLTALPLGQRTRAEATIINRCQLTSCRKPGAIVSSTRMGVALVIVPTQVERSSRRQPMNFPLL